MKTFFTPGPSQLYPTVPKHLETALARHILSISHRSKAFKEIFSESVARLKLLLGIPDEYRVVFLSSATEAMERSIQGVVRRKSLHISMGAFGDKFYEVAKLLGKDATNYHFQFSGVDAASIAALITDDELICFTHNETSNGSAIPLDLIYKICQDFPESLIAVDVVSSIPYVNLDYSVLDLIFFSVQKGFGLPAGLGVLIVSPRAYQHALELEEEGWDTGSYHRLVTLINQAESFQTPETPNVLNQYLFMQVLGDMLEKGIDTIRGEIRQKARMWFEFFDTHPEFTSGVATPYRSETVLVVGHPDTSALHAKTKAEDFIIGKGYGRKKEEHIRIANFPALTMNQHQKLLNLFS